MFIIPKINGELLKNREHGNYFLKDEVQVNIGDFAPWVIRAFVERVNLNCNLAVGITDRNAHLTIIRNPLLAQEGYTIDVLPETIKLSASNEIGVIWGLSTVYQMFVEAIQTNQNGIEPQSFRDEPKYKHRGLMVDVGRHFFDADEMKKIIEEMSVYKLNVLHWHLSEDQGWRIESKIYPKLHENASNGQYYTQEQIKEIVQFAKARGIDVIPEIDMPGHCSAAISAYKELSCFDEEIPMATTYGVFRVVMCAGKESTYEWIRNLLDEVTELFPSRYFHLGGDECPKDKWKQCLHCKELMRRNGIESYEDLQGYFMNEISEYLRTKEKIVIGWNDILKANNISKDMVIQYWLESTPASYAYPCYSAGQKMVFSDMFNLYFSSPHCMVQLKKIYEFQPKIRENIGLKGDNILGLEAAIWTETITTKEELESLLSLRIQALAEAAWTNDRNYKEFLERLKAHIETNQIIKLYSLPLEEVALTEDQAMMKALEYMRAMAGPMREVFVDTGLTQEEHDMIGKLLQAEVFGDMDIREFAKKLGFASDLVSKNKQDSQTL